MALLKDPVCLFVGVDEARSGSQWKANVTSLCKNRKSEREGEREGNTVAEVTLAII